MGFTIGNHEDFMGWNQGSGKRCSTHTEADAVHLLQFSKGVLHKDLRYLGWP